VKVRTAKIIIIQEDDQRPVWYTDPRKAAEHWARIKSEEWVEKRKDLPQYKNSRGYTSLLANGDGKIRYRKLMRRALRVFRKAMDINS
jgi:hypothetical protein